MEQTVKINMVEGYDVAVCGGGIAGIAAALAAARHGKKVVLFERQYMLGGLAIAGLITIYLPLCDGMGKQVSFGIAEELLKLSIKHGAEARYPKNWLDGEGTRTETDQRYAVRYNAQLFAILAEPFITVPVVFAKAAAGNTVAPSHTALVKIPDISPSLNPISDVNLSDASITADAPIVETAPIPAAIKPVPPVATPIAKPVAILATPLTISAPVS